MIAAAVTGTMNTWAETFSVKPTQTTIIQSDKADDILYDANATTWNTSQASISSNGSFKGSYIAITKFDAGSTLKDRILLKASLSFHSVCTVSGKDSRVDVSYIDTQWDAETATWNSINKESILHPEKLYSTSSNVNTSGRDISIDITDKLAADEDKAIGFAIYTYTAREQEISNLVLNIEAIDAATAAQYTVKKEYNGKLLSSEQRWGTIDTPIEITDKDKEPIYVGDTKKYVYESDDADNKTVSSDGQSVVTIKFNSINKYVYNITAVYGTEELKEYSGGFFEDDV